jgi:two-component system OmpR family response regulator
MSEAVNEAVADILIVDDDPEIRVLLANSLGNQGYRVHTAAGAREMDRILAQANIDLVLLDVMMPGEDGLSICRRLTQEQGPAVIMLSALGDEPDRILGLELGAGHYLSKPCSPREILAHVRAALRQRRSAVTQERHRVLGFAGWRIDLASHELTDPDGVIVDLTDGEFAVLRAFVERPRRVLTREALLEAARGPDSDAFDRAIDVQVSRLRRKLKAQSDEIIRTVRNEGYLFCPQVRAA